MAMGAPTSAIFLEIYLQYIEHTFIYDILIHNNVRGYFRYVDEILLIYDTEITDTHTVLQQFNAIAPTSYSLLRKSNKTN